MAGHDKGVFHSAITDSDGVSVNVGYLSLFWIMAIVLTVIPFMCFLAIFEFGLAQSCQAINNKLICYRPHAFNVQSLGIGIGAVTAAFSTALAALGVFLWGDRRPSVPPTTETK